MDETAIYRYLSGNATENEQKEIYEWIKASQENQSAFFEIKAVWSVKRAINKTYNTELSLKQLNKRIQKVEPLQNKHVYSKIVGYCTAIAAAILLFILFIPTLIEEGSVVEDADYISASNIEGDTIKTVYLSDGTTVWLRRNSTLTYPTIFNGNCREVHLEGEAFFEVTKDPAHPFIVKTGDNEIKVLGTSFSVCSNDADNLFETVLMSGSICLNDKHGKEIATLHPGQQALYSKNTQSVEIKEVDANSLTSWRFGLISLSDASIFDILRCIEDTYNIHIKMDTYSLENRTYNFSFKRSKGAQEALNQLSYITDKSAEIIP